MLQFRSDVVERLLSCERRGGLGRPAMGRPLALVAVGLMVTLLAMPGCGPKTVKRAPATPPPPTYTGPDYLRGTVSSLARLRAGDDQPLLVSGYGIVVFPPGTGTGSSTVPSFMRQWLINEMRKLGIGSPRLAAQAPDVFKPFFSMSPEEFLASRDTAVVAVQGLIPPGAVTGTRFDVLVSALPQTETTSLAGGTLWTTSLSIDGTNPSMNYSRELAEASGPIYLRPFDRGDAPAAAAPDPDPADPADADLDDTPSAGPEFAYQGAVIAGGKALQPRRLELVLNQPSWLRSRAIADRINERYPAQPGERLQTAEAQTDLVVRLNVPRRFANDPRTLLELIGHLYVQRGVGFEATQAQRLVELLRERPEEAYHVVMAWRSLGKAVIPVLREQLYEDPDLDLRLAALEAGAWLEDERASLHLAELADHPEPLIRRRVAEALVHLPRSFRAAGTLRALLDDDDQRVRIAAYESLARMNDRTVLRRFGIHGARGLKFIIDQVPAEKPLVYITQENIPRLVIFGPELGFDAPMIAGLWDNQLMLKAQSPDQPLEVYYQPPRQIRGKTYQTVPTVATLAYLMGHRPSLEDPQDGLDLTYSQVVHAIYQLCQEGHIPAPVEVNISPLARVISEYHQGAPVDIRPETSATPPSAPDGDPASDAAVGLIDR